MKKVIDPVSINDVANYTKNKLEELENAKNILKNDIESIRTFYKGRDAELIINKYLERLKVVDVIINNYSNLKEYFSSISLLYSNSLKKSCTSMNQINNNLSLKSNTIETDNLEKQTLSINL